MMSVVVVCIQFHFAGRQRCRANVGKCDGPAEGASNEGGSAGMTPTKSPFITLANPALFQEEHPAWHFFATLSNSDVYIRLKITNKGDTLKIQLLCLSICLSVVHMILC